MAAGQAHATSSSSHGDQWDALQSFRDVVQEIKWRPVCFYPPSLQFDAQILYLCLEWQPLGIDLSVPGNDKFELGHAGVSSVFSPAQELAQGVTSFDISIYCLPIQ